MDAARARELGLVNRVVPAAALAESTMELAQLVASKLPSAVRLGKRGFREQQGLSLADAYQRGGAIMCENLMLPETDEGMAAFLKTPALLGELSGWGGRPSRSAPAPETSPAASS